jgi:cell wall-associated NlpC family hydrolase
LVFFYSPISHVGIYIGEGLMIHAPNPRTVVKVSQIDTMAYVGARRVG